VVLNSIPLATNPNGALLLTWLLDSSSFPNRYSLLAPRFTPHLSHLCTHKLASLTVLRLVNQKVEPQASSQVVEGLFLSQGDQVLTDVLGDQVNGVAVVHKVLTSPFLSPQQREECVEATKRVLIELKVIATQAYRRLIEEVGLQVPMYQTPFGQPANQQSPYSKSKNSNFSIGSPDLAPMMNNLQIQALAANQSNYPASNTQYHHHHHSSPTPNYGQHSLDRGGRGRGMAGSGHFSPANDPFNPFGLRSPEMSPLPMTRGPEHLPDMHHLPAQHMQPMPYPSQPANHPNHPPQGNPSGGVNQQGYSLPLPPHLYQAYYQAVYQPGNPQNVGGYQ
jgi:protein JSN1